MIYLDLTIQQTISKYHIRPINEICRNCGVTVDVDIPVISKEWVGYESKNHGCGRKYTISYVKKTNGNDGVTKVNFYGDVR